LKHNLNILVDESIESIRHEKEFGQIVGIRVVSVKIDFL